MFRVMLALLLLGCLWLVSLRLSPARGRQLALVGSMAFAINIVRAGDQGLSWMALVTFNFSDTGLLLVNLLSAVSCALALMVWLRIQLRRHDADG